MKTYLTYGFANALGGLLLSVVLFLLGFHSNPEKLGTGQLLGFVLGLAIAVACIALGTKSRRAEIPANEPFGYGRALGTGVMIALFAAIFGTIGYLIYITLINPEMTEVALQAQIAKMEAAGKMSSAQIEQAEPFMRKMMSPGVQAAFAFVGTFIFGTVISLITSAFLKRTETAQPPVSA